jgi:hypothetical protein
VGGVHENDANVRGQVVADAGAMQARRSWDTDMVTPAVHALCSGDGARREGCAPDMLQPALTMEPSLTVRAPRRLGRRRRRAARRAGLLHGGPSGRSRALSVSLRTKSVFYGAFCMGVRGM